MKEKLRKKKKSKVKYYSAPPKKRVSYFFTSFFITLSLLLTLTGLFIANRNSIQVGFGKDVQVFSFSKSGNSYDLNLGGETLSVDKSGVDETLKIIAKIKTVKLANEPEPLYFIDTVRAAALSLEHELLNEYGPV